MFIYLEQYWGTFNEHFVSMQGWIMLFYKTQKIKIYQLDQRIQTVNTKNGLIVMLQDYIEMNFLEQKC